MIREKRLLVTAGPTVEDIDPVRFISNRSSGKMGVAIANAAAERGWKVILIHGPLRDCRPNREKISTLPVRSAEDMLRKVNKHIQAVDCAVFAAAVSDFRPATKSIRKLKKSDLGRMELEMERTPDILSTIGKLPRHPFLVGFAAETNELESNALEKMREKGCDMLCANLVGYDGRGFESDSNEIAIYRPDTLPLKIPLQSKENIAKTILSEIEKSIQIKARKQ